MSLFISLKSTISHPITQLMANKEAQLSIKPVIDAPIVTNQGHQNHLLVPAKPSILTKLHAGYFRISISCGGQALLWKILSEYTDDSQALLRVFHMLPSTAFLLLWCLSLFTLVLLSLLYILKCFFHFHMVKAEFMHHVGANYLFAPWISWILLLQSAPLMVSHTIVHQVLWWVFAVPIIMLDCKIYGQWFTTEKRFLSMLANPTSQVSVLGNLVGALAAAQMGWRESAVCMFSLGMTHYLVVFVTLYQRLSGGIRLPAKLRPIYFLFIAAPSMASLAWNSISSTFDTSSKMLFFLSLFLFISLASRPALFKKSMKHFSVAWWAYSFPLTFLALASAVYAHEVKGQIASILMLILLALSVLVFLGLMIFTVFNTDKLLSKKDLFLSFGHDVGMKTGQNPCVRDSNQG